MDANVVGHKMRIARAMKKPPMNQQELLAGLQTAGLDISQPTLSKIENGERYVTDIELKVIAKVLDVGILWLLGESEDIKK